MSKEKKEVKEQKIPIYTEEFLRNLKSHEYRPIEAENTFIIFGGKNLNTPTKAIKLSEFIEYIIGKI